MRQFCIQFCNSVSHTLREKHPGRGIPQVASRLIHPTIGPSNLPRASAGEFSPCVHLRDSESDPLGAVHSVGSNLGTCLNRKKVNPYVFIGAGRRSITALSKLYYGKIQFDCPFSLKFIIFLDEVYLWRQIDPTEWTAPSGSQSPAAVLSSR